MQPNDPLLFYTARKHAAVRTEEYLYNQLIPYIGNKRKLLWMIAEAVRQTGVSSGTFVDFFAGSSVVSRFAKVAGYRVIANDWEPYAGVISHCYIKCNTMPSFDQLGGPEQVFSTLNRVTPVQGYITTNLCPIDDEHADPDSERMFYTRVNGMKIDAMREQICKWQVQQLLTDDELAVLIASLMYSVSYTSNTSGVFKAFHRGWGGETGTALYRILSNIELRPPVLYNNQQPKSLFRNSQ
jgi:adenine-specific DNA-methyltransferase